MDTIKFVVEQYKVEEFEHDLPVINIYINGQNLIDLVTRIEKKDWNGEKDSRSGYIGIEATRFGRFRNEMLGNKVYRHSILLTCTCTIEECNCIMADITFDTATVTWSNIRSPWLSNTTFSPFVDEVDAVKEGWIPLDYSALGSFVFDREQYLSALDEAIQNAERVSDEYLRNQPDSGENCGLLTWDDL